MANQTSIDAAFENGGLVWPLCVAAYSCRLYPWLLIKLGDTRIYAASCIRFDHHSNLWGISNDNQWCGRACLETERYARWSGLMSLNTHFTTWWNRGSDSKTVDKPFVKSSHKLRPPLLKCILCHVSHFMFWLYKIFSSSVHY